MGENMEESKDEFEQLVEFMEKIFEADRMSKEKQEDIQTKLQRLREETRIVRVEEGKKK